MSDEFQLQLELWNIAIWLAGTTNSMIISFESLTGWNKLVGGELTGKILGGSSIIRPVGAFHY